MYLRYKKQVAMNIYLMCIQFSYNNPKHMSYVALYLWHLNV